MNPKRTFENVIGLAAEMPNFRWVIYFDLNTGAFIWVFDLRMPAEV